MAPNTKSVDPKINTQVWLSYMKKTTIPIQMKGKSMAQRTDTRWNLKRHISLVSSIQFMVIVAKFGGHAFHHLASTLANVIRQGGKQTKNLV